MTQVDHIPLRDSLVLNDHSSSIRKSMSHNPMNHGGLTKAISIATQISELLSTFSSFVIPCCSDESHKIPIASQHDYSITSRDEAKIQFFTALNTIFSRWQTLANASQVTSSTLSEIAQEQQRHMIEQLPRMIAIPLSGVYHPDTCLQQWQNIDTLNQYDRAVINLFQEYCRSHTVPTTHCDAIELFLSIQSLHIVGYPPHSHPYSGDQDPSLVSIDNVVSSSIENDVWYPVPRDYMLQHPTTATTTIIAQSQSANQLNNQDYAVLPPGIETDSHINTRNTSSEKVSLLLGQIKPCISHMNEICIIDSTTTTTSPATTTTSIDSVFTPHCNHHNEGLHHIKYISTTTDNDTLIEHCHYRSFLVLVPLWMSDDLLLSCNLPMMVNHMCDTHIQYTPHSIDNELVLCASLVSTVSVSDSMHIRRLCRTIAQQLSLCPSLCTSLCTYLVSYVILCDLLGERDIVDTVVRQCIVMCDTHISHVDRLVYHWMCTRPFAQCMELITSIWDNHSHSLYSNDLLHIALYISISRRGTDSTSRVCYTTAYDTTMLYAGHCMSLYPQSLRSSLYMFIVSLFERDFFNTPVIERRRETELGIDCMHIFNDDDYGNSDDTLHVIDLFLYCMPSSSSDCCERVICKLTHSLLHINVTIDAYNYLHQFLLNHIPNLLNDERKLSVYAVKMLYTLCKERESFLSHHLCPNLTMSQSPNHSIHYVTKSHRHYTDIGRGTFTASTPNHMTSSSGGGHHYTRSKGRSSHAHNTQDNAHTSTVPHITVKYDTDEDLDEGVEGESDDIHQHQHSYSSVSRTATVSPSMPQSDSHHYSGEGRQSISSSIDHRYEVSSPNASVATNCWALPVSLALFREHPELGAFLTSSNEETYRMTGFNSVAKAKKFSSTTLSSPSFGLTVKVEGKGVNTSLLIKKSMNVCIAYQKELVKMIEDVQGVKKSVEEHFPFLFQSIGVKDKTRRNE